MHWHSKNKSATIIHSKLCKYFPYEKISYSIIANWIRKLNRGEDIFERKTGSGRIADTQINQRILNSLMKCHFIAYELSATFLKYQKQQFTIIYTQWDSLLSI